MIALCGTGHFFIFKHKNIREAITTIKVTLPDGSVREYEKGVMIYDVAKSISEGLARNTLGAVVNG